MAILKEEIVGTKIINLIKSSNIKKTTYDVGTNDLIVEFNSGINYVYFKVPINIYTKFRNAESQGRFFSTEISKNFTYKKL